MLSRPSRVVPAKPSPESASPIRQAANEFVHGTAFGWGRRELATWLVCQYSPCLVADAAVHPDGGVLSDGIATSMQLDDESLERLILDARCGVLKLLADLPWPSEVAIHAEAAIGAGHVVATHDASGARRWVPVGRKRMRLVERVGSLLIADALENPSDYLMLSLCRTCSELLFGGKAEHQATCGNARHVA